LHKAQLAGLLHDCAKCIPDEKKLSMCKEYSIPITNIQEQNPYLLHGILGAYLAKTEYEIDDASILSAITYHTTGRADMQILEKIIFIADYIEPMRDKAADLSMIRRLAFHDLDECMYVILKTTLTYLFHNNPENIDSTTHNAYVYYNQLHELAHSDQNKEKGRKQGNESK
jgi:predicted HD superfamily hydrolase involved in NAD metabolism